MSSTLQSCAFYEVLISVNGHWVCVCINLFVFFGSAFTFLNSRILSTVALLRSQYIYIHAYSNFTLFCSQPFSKFVNNPISKEIMSTTRTYNIFAPKSVSLLWNWWMIYFPLPVDSISCLPFQFLFLVKKGSNRKQHGGQCQCHRCSFLIYLILVSISNSTPTEQCLSTAWTETNYLLTYLE